MSPRFHRHNLLLDEGLYPRKSLPRVNSRHNVKHIKHDLNSAGIKDKEVYKIAIQQKRIIVTYNTRDFKRFARLSKNAGTQFPTDQKPREIILRGIHPFSKKGIT